MRKLFAFRCDWCSQRVSRWRDDEHRDTAEACVCGEKLRRCYETAGLIGAAPRLGAGLDREPDVAEIDQDLRGPHITMTDCEASGSGSGVAVQVNGPAKLDVDGFVTNDRVAFSGSGKGELRVRRLRHDPERRT